MTKKWLRHESGQTDRVQTELADFNSSNALQAGQRQFRLLILHKQDRVLR